MRPVAQEERGGSGFAASHFALAARGLRWRHLRYIPRTIREIVMRKMILAAGLIACGASGAIARSLPPGCTWSKSPVEYQEFNGSRFSTHIVRKRGDGALLETRA
jgi:hypothetical protein